MSEQLPVLIISLAQAANRRQFMNEQVKAAGITNFEFVDAADCQNESTYTTTELHNYTHGWRRAMWDQGQAFIRSKIAIDLSHFRVLERIAASNRPAVVLEDDAQLDMVGTQWLPDLLTALQELPEDWDLMYLNTIWSQKGRQISPHLVAIRWTPSAIGCIATPAFARKVLQSARSPRYNSWVDIIFELLERHREAQAYLVQPPLVGYAPMGTTTAAHAAAGAQFTTWDRLRFKSWAGNRRLLWR